MRRLVAVGATLGLLLLVSPASAHSTDPRIVSVIDGVRPALPTEVVVQVRANLAAQLVVDNPTVTPLDVLAPTGQPFLRISRAGVFGNLGSGEFFATSTPNGGTTHPSGADRFVQLSTGHSWGWYDHRLHPLALAAPRDERHRARLGTFEVPLRYGGTAVTVRGHLEFQPLLGQFEDTVSAAPPGLSASVLQGRLPGLFVTVQAPLTVLGRDGEPFLRSDGRVLSINTSSRTYVEDQQARGVQVGPPAVTASWKRLPGRTFTWLDDRLRYASAAPPDRALRRSGATVIGSWRIPVLAGSSSTALTGDIRWVPSGVATSSAAGRPVWPYVGGALVVLLAAAAAIRLRRRA
jgi:hypothetical protein